MNVDTICKSRKYHHEYFCFFCDKTFRTIKKASLQHDYCQKRHSGQILGLKKIEGYVCRLHNPPLDCLTGPNLRRHLYIFHRAQQDAYLVKGHQSQRIISDLPKTYAISLARFKKEVDRMTDHSSKYGDPLELDGFHEFFNSSLDIALKD